MNIYTKTLIGSWIAVSLFLWYLVTFGESKDIPQERDTEQRVNYEEAAKIAINLSSLSFKSVNASSSAEAYTILLSGYTFKIQ